MDDNTDGFRLLVILALSVGKVSSQCTLPTELQNSIWTYNGVGLTFTTSQMTGLIFNAEGTFINTFHCVSSLNNVVVWESQNTFTQQGQPKRIFLCMKFTKVSDNLFYFHLLSDNYSGLVIPINHPAVVRFQVIDANVASAGVPTCTFCQYSTGNEPLNTEAQFLHRQGTNESPQSDTKVCPPCEGTCQTPDPDSCEGVGGVCQHRSKPCAPIPNKKCKRCHHRCCQVAP